MNDKVREQFQAWYLAEMLEMFGEDARSQIELNLAWSRDDGSYADPMLRLGLMAWQASRETLVVERPEKCEFAEPGGDYEKGYRQGVRSMVDRIEAQGLKVKP